MSFRRNTVGGIRSASVDRQPQPSSSYTNDSNLDLATKPDLLPNITPELIKFIRKLLPKELLVNNHVRHVEYIEHGYERLIGTLYLTTFRLVFAPDKEIEDKTLITSGNKYLGEYDIPLASIYKINVAPVDSRQGFKSFLHEHQIQSETRTFTIITRDFRSVTFTKCSVTNSNTNKTKNSYASVDKMENYIDALKFQGRCQNRDQLYLYVALQQNSSNNLSPRANRSYTLSTGINSRSIDDHIADFCLSNDERIKSYMTVNDWKEELYEANEQQWDVDRKKFNNQQIVQDEGPYVRMVNSNDFDGSSEYIWHWTHTSQMTNEYYNRRQIQPEKYMLITVPGIGEVNITGDPPESPISIPIVPSSSPFRFHNIKKKIPKSFRFNPTDGPKLIFTNETKFTTTTPTTSNNQLTPDVGLRRVTTDTNLVSSAHFICEQPFQRYNLAKFPCPLKRLQASYEKLIEICVTVPDDDDDKWLSRLNTCKWLKYVSKALHGAASLAKLLNFKNIELAGSDTDNNCLISSLIQIYLRPKCRTTKGFCELIVREWIIRGHKFRERFGQVRYDMNGYLVQESPVFLLFLDCIHQLIIQNPFSFEFTDCLLLELYRNICYGYHHTFTFNNIIERLEAIENCPNNLLVLSSFDFSLYLYPNTCRLLKNDASIFNLQKFSPQQQQKQKQTKSRIETTVIYPVTSPQQRTNRTVYLLESPKSSSLKLDIPITNGNNLLNSEQYDYDIIESPQIFSNDFYVDWRTFNLVLWSKCYCRYDQNNTNSLIHEEKLSYEINSLKGDIEKFQIKSSQRQITLDTYHYIGYANSWHPQALDTRV